MKMTKMKEKIAIMGRIVTIARLVSTMTIIVVVAMWRRNAAIYTMEDTPFVNSVKITITFIID